MQEQEHDIIVTETEDGWEFQISADDLDDSLEHNLFVTIDSSGHSPFEFGVNVGDKTVVGTVTVIDGNDEYTVKWDSEALDAVYWD